MKRFLSTLLVAMLIVTCLSTAVFAAGNATVKAGTVTDAVPGGQATVTFTVTGVFANYELIIKTEPALKLVSVTGVVGNVNSTSDRYGKVAYANDENLSKHTFTATFEVPATATCGDSFKVTAEVLFVSDRNLQKQNVSVVDGKIAVNHKWVETGSTTADCQTVGEKHYTCSICGKKKTETGVKGDHTWGAWTEHSKGDCKTVGQEVRVCSVCGEKEFRDTQLGDHSWGEWAVVPGSNCTEDVMERRVCSLCGEIDERSTGAKGEHEWEEDWDFDKTHHWHACKFCGEKNDHGKHIFPEEGVKSEDGELRWFICTVCGFGQSVPTGDHEIMIIVGIAAMSAVLAAAAFVCKRKFIG